MTKRHRRTLAIWFVISSLMFVLSATLAMTAHAQSNFVIPSDTPNRNSTMIRSAPTYVQARVLAASVSETITLPAGTRLVVFSSTCNFYALPGNSAAVPAADVTDGTASELNPAAWYFSNAATATQNVTVITPDASCVVTASAYKGALQ